MLQTKLVMPNANDMPFGTQDVLDRILHLKIDYKLIVVLSSLHVSVFHLSRVLFYLLLVACFFISFCAYHIKSKENLDEFNDYLVKRRKKYVYSGGLIRIESYLASMLENEDNFRDSTNSLHNQLDNRSLQNYGVTKPALTGSYLIDDEIHKIIDLIMRDYIDIWYKNEISSRDDFRQTIRSAIHNAIRYIHSCLKEIEWEQFIMNILAQNLVFQMRMFKKAKEKRSKLNLDNTVLKNEILKAIKELSDQQSTSPNLQTSSSQPQNSSDKNKKILINDLLSSSSFLQAAMTAANQNESNLVELFFDLEAEKEKGICRDDISFNSGDRESDILQEISELICFSILPAAEFNCLPLRCLFREILSNHLIKTTVNNLTDPDYINQTILYVCQDQTQPKTENFLLAINYSESLDELKELRNRIDEEILKTRSYDKGGQNDQEIKQRLSSLQYIKRKIEACILNLFKINNKIGSQNSPTESLTDSSGRGSVQLPRSSSDIFLFNQHLMTLDFKTVCTNETIQHCFIEYMGKQNVQNLISFYLNADMYRQFAQKELEKNKDRDQTETKLALRDFANGLINSYLLSATNFTASTQDEDDQPVNIANRIFYKPELIRTVERLDMVEHLNETLLDDLQNKIFQLMKQKYYPDFKSHPEFQKILLKNDLLFRLTSTNVTSPDRRHSPKQELVKATQEFGEDACEDDEYFTSSLQHTGLSDSLIDEDSLIIMDDGPGYDRLSQSSYDSINFQADSGSKTVSPLSQQSNLKPVNYKFKLSAQITSSGVCNELKKTYAIYIIDVTKLYPASPEQNDYWQTYRRFNDFYDLHLTIKKRFANLNSFTLPGKNFRNSLTEKFIEHRKCELNRYLQTLCNPDTIANNPKLMDLLLQFLENKPWDNSQTNFTRRFDSIFTPMISSVQNIQTSINENVIGMVKGISDNLNPVVNTFSKMNSAVPSSKGGGQDLGNSDQEHDYMSLGRNMSNISSNSPLVTKVQIDKRDLIAIDKTILNTDDMQSNNFPVRVVLMLIDEIFDLKEKNQWIRQSLMLIVKTYMKNFKGDSMNKKIKEQIADLISEEYLARYFKNFRKRIWPKGYLAAPKQERSKSIKEVTKVLAKTKLLTIVSDDLRHILGNDTTRRGIFEMFDLFQHKPLNKRLFHILAENLLANFFQADTNKLNFNTLPPQINTGPNVISIKTLSPQVQYQSNLQNSPFIQVIRCHLTKSSRVKPEWKILDKNSNLKLSGDYGYMLHSASTRASMQSLISLGDKQACSRHDLTNKERKDEEEQQKQQEQNLMTPQAAMLNIQRSRSLHTDINC